ncbi:MAG: ATP-binding cassette domain-containing protein [Acidobacteria bacterium]|nr:ATP-binding cassette domain-containing protein [Acidobacteriota bacterium]
MKPIIRVENLSKQYRIGAQQASYGTLRDSLTNTVTAPFRRFKDSRNSKPETRNSETIWALKDINFEVMPGEIVGIIGRNGAGKSTLLKILSRITEPTTGRIDLYGRVGSLLEVGTGFHAELTGRENIYLNGTILGMKREEITRRFDEIVAFAEIEKFLDTPVKHYSSGMYMRLAFAVAAHLEPEILVIDEVLAVGDAEFQKKCLGKMQDVASQGRTVLFVSHNMNAIEQLCSTAFRLDKGRICENSRDVRSVILPYLSAGAMAERSEWVNADNKVGSPWFSPHRLSLVDACGNPLPMPASNNKEIVLRIEADIKEYDPALEIGYGIYAEDGVLIYLSFHTDIEPAKWSRLGAGKYSLYTAIPRRLLNEGTYRIDLFASLYYREWILKPTDQVPSINLVIKGGLSDSPRRLVKRPGMLAPMLAWEAIQSNEGEAVE